MTKNIPTHPASYAGAVASNGVASSKFEGLEPTINMTTGSVGQLVASANYFPRALISRHKIVNADFNWVPNNSE